MIFRVWSTKAMDLDHPTYPGIFGAFIDPDGEPYKTKPWTLWCEYKMLDAYWEKLANAEVQRKIDLIVQYGVTNKSMLG